MAYNTKPIVTDKDGNPISQYYNPETDQYEPVEGSNGANKVLVVNNDLSLHPILEKLNQLVGTVIDEEIRKSNEQTRQSNEQLRIQLYNDLLDELERIEQIQKQVPESVLEAINALRDELGNLESLETADKSSIVNAINEVNTKIDEIEIIDMDAENVSYDNTESGLVSNNVQTAIDEVYADLTSHKAEKVTQEQDGHMTKEDKIKLDGIEEGANKTDYYRNIAILPHDEEDKFNIGTNIYIPTVSASNEYYSAWRAEIANILGIDDETVEPFRIVIETIKQHSSYMIQNVYAYSNYTATMGSHLFTFHRVYGFGNNKWRDWQVKRPISLYSEGSPEGVVAGIYGALCLDILNNKLYIKKGSKRIGATNTGWELIGGA